MRRSSSAWNDRIARSAVSSSSSSSARRRSARPDARAAPPPTDARAQPVEERLPHLRVPHQQLGQPIAGAEQRPQHPHQPRVIAQQRHEADRAAQRQIAKVRQGAIGIGRGDRLLQERHRQRAPTRSSVSAAASTSRKPAAATRRSSSARSRIGSSSRAASRCASAAARPAWRRSPPPPPASRPPRRRRRPDRRTPGHANAPRASSSPAAGVAAHRSPPAPGARAAAKIDRRRAASGTRDRQQTRHHQARQRARRVALAQIGPLAGVQELQRLHHHLDVADATRAELDVEPGLAERPGGVGRIAEQRAQPPHLFDHPRLDVARIDERVERRQQLVTERRSPAAGRARNQACRSQVRPKVS